MPTAARASASPAAATRVDAARAVVDRQTAGGPPIYGINTGFGSFAEVTIESDAVETLQLNLRSQVPALDDDRPPSPDITAITELIATGLLEDASGNLVK